MDTSEVLHEGTSQLTSIQAESHSTAEHPRCKSVEQQDVADNPQDEPQQSESPAESRHMSPVSSGQHWETGGVRQHGRAGEGQPEAGKPLQRNQFGAALTANLEGGLVGQASQQMYEEMVQATKKSVRFRGVTRHKRTQRYEAHIWEAKKQIYLGGFDSEVMAAKSHDIMALKCKDTASEVLNFPQEEYADLAPFMPLVTREDVIGALRAFSKAQALARTTSLTKVSKGRVQKPPAQINRQAASRKLSVSTPPITAASTPAEPRGSPNYPPSPAKRAPVVTFKREARLSTYLPLTPKADRCERLAPTTPTAPICVEPPTQTAPLELRPCQDDITPSPFGYIQQQLRTTAKRSRRTYELFHLDSETEDDEGEESKAAATPAVVSHGRSCSPVATSIVEPEASSSSTTLIEPSLTFSASEESRLYEWMPVDSGHSGLEHTLNGTVLFRSPQQLEEHRNAALAFTQQLACAQSCITHAQQEMAAPGRMSPGSNSEAGAPICPVTAIAWPGNAPSCWPCLA